MGVRLRLLLAAIAGILVGAWLMSLVGPHPDSTGLNWPVVSVVKRVTPSVVVVLNNRRSGDRQEVRGMGSGVILNRHGDIVTNYHVVQGSDSLTVVLFNGRRYRARLVGTDPPTDLAVIRIDASRLTPIAFASSATVEPGQLVVAIGNSLGFDHTVTVGVVSARDRVMYRDGWEYHLIQTDAAINPGNSGGPLLNVEGRLIGINSSKIAQTGVEGIGFAIPSDTVQDVVHQILHYGHVRRPWIGVTLQPLSDRKLGMMVVSVVGPAQEAGVKPGDLLQSVNDQPVHDLGDVIKVLEKNRVGQRIRLGLLRGTEHLSVSVTLQELPSSSLSQNAS